MRILRPLVSLACLAFTAVLLPAQGAAPKTVLDYFNLLTKEELLMLDTEKPRQSLIKVQDVANGFLSLEVNDAQGLAQVALFRKKDRAAVIGVAQTECGPACVGSVKFLQYQDGKWQDVTDALLPKTTDAQVLAAYNRSKKSGDDEYTLKDPPHVYWELPRSGTTVKMCGEGVAGANDKVLMRFTWDGTRFTRATK